MCLTHQGASIDTHVDLLRSASNVKITNPQVKILPVHARDQHMPIRFDAFQRHKHDSVRIIVLTFLIQKLFAVNNLLFQIVELYVNCNS